MEKILYNKYAKRKIKELPIDAFKGRIITILSACETERAVDYLLSHEILGVDTETRPSFKKGVFYKVSLLQVSTYDICFLFRLNHTGMTPAIIRLLEDTTVPKIGLSWHDDIAALKKHIDFTPGYFIDVQHIVGSLGIEDISLQKLYANLFGKQIRKNKQLSNWEKSVLTQTQKLYAATDAWACIMLYEEIMRLKETNDYILEKIVVDNEIQENIPETR